MASPEWFFSTIAQATAAIVGFVIAFSAVIYQNERQRREQRTESLREGLSELRTKYKDIVETMSTSFGKRVDLELESMGPSDPKYRDADPADYPGDHLGLETRAAIQEYLDDPLNSDATEFEDQLEEWERVDKPITILTYFHLLRVRDLLDRIQPSSNTTSHYLLSLDEFDTLGESLEILTNIFGHTDLEQTSHLFNELRGESDNLAYGTFYSEKAFGGPIEENIAVDEVTDWLLEYVRPKIADRLSSLKQNLRPREDLNEDNEEEEEPFTADSIAMWSLVFDELEADFRELDIQRYNTILDPPHRMTRILSISGILLLVGAFIPMVFLLTIPSTLPVLNLGIRSLLLFQIVLLGVSGILSIYLLYVVARNLYPE